MRRIDPVACDRKWLATIHAESYIHRAREECNSGATLNCPMSAGFDAHIADPLGAISLSTDFYRWVTAPMMEIADACNNERLISLLEGGYDLHVLAECIGIHLHTLNNAPE